MGDPLEMKASLVLLAALLGLCVWTTACGGTAPEAREASVGKSPSIASSGYRDDGDNNARSDETRGEKYIEGGRYHDHDDLSILTSGAPASAAVEQKVSAVVMRFYAAAAADNGASACSLLEPSLAKASAGYFGGSSGPAYLRGAKNCTQLMDMQFKYSRKQLSTDVRVTGVRVSAGRAIAILASKTSVAGYLSLLLEGGIWRVGMLVSEPFT